LIVAGTKRVEFRRIWAAKPVSWIAVYSTSPIKMIVGVVEIESVVVASPTRLWELNGIRGGGLTRLELREYFAGNREGYALLLGRTFLPSSPIDPSKLDSGFRAPQSFRYLTTFEASRIRKEIRG